jgi:hypothetical protein
MRVLAILVLCSAGGLVARAEPAWGSNCLSCHGGWQPAAIRVVDYDATVDPNEAATGAPDRGPLHTFRLWRGQTRALTAEVLGLLPGETYAVQLKRLRYPGVEHNGTLVYGADCDWPEWGESAPYYTQPATAFTWGSGPALLDYALRAAPTATNDYYDLVLAVAGKAADGALLYAEEHFYVQVRGTLGDVNCDGVVSFADINPFVLALTSPTGYAAQYPACSASLADVNADGVVGFGDINPFVYLLTHP